MVDMFFELSWSWLAEMSLYLSRFRYSSTFVYVLLAAVCGSPYSISPSRFPSTFGVLPTASLCFELAARSMVEPPIMLKLFWMVLLLRWLTWLLATLIYEYLALIFWLALWFIKFYSFFKLDFLSGKESPKLMLSFESLFLMLSWCRS